MTTKTVYVADDGTEWATQKEALLRDTELKLANQIWTHCDTTVDERDIRKIIHKLHELGHLVLV